MSLDKDLFGRQLTVVTWHRNKRDFIEEAAIRIRAAQVVKGFSNNDALTEAIGLWNLIEDYFTPRKPE